MWKTAAYAAAGRGHIKQGIPCQDKVKTCRNGKVTVISLADGAGSAPLSHFGAEAVLNRVSADIGGHFADYFNEEPSAVRMRVICCALDALGEAQRAHQCALKDLSSTLLVAAVSGHRYLLVHIGDGVIGYLKDGEVKTAAAPDNGEFANETVFTTSPDAVSRMRIFRGTDEKICGFVLMSDGTGTALYNRRTGELSRGVKRMMQMSLLCPEMAYQMLLRETFHDAIMHFTQDDCSIAILTDSHAFPDYFGMPMDEKLDLLQISREGRRRGRRLRLAGEILRAASAGAGIDQIAKRIHIKSKYVRRKVHYLAELGFLERDRGIYRSALNDHDTRPDSEPNT